MEDCLSCKSFIGVGSDICKRCKLAYEKPVTKVEVEIIPEIIVVKPVDLTVVSLVIIYHLRKLSRIDRKELLKGNIPISKEELVNMLGGACVICGYSRSLGALQFHHLLSEDKDGAISKMIKHELRDAVIAEVNKCILVCATCHAEIHYGMDEKYYKSLLNS
jgi:hypothetical protein